MRARKWTGLLVAAAACIVLGCPVLAEPQVHAGAQRGMRWGLEARRSPADERLARRAPRGYQEPAFARGYTDGYGRGMSDGHGHDRYDPVRYKDYRDGDQGYVTSYGSKDAYRTNYRAGFRQGYEDGYRDSTR